MPAVPADQPVWHLSRFVHVNGSARIEVSGDDPRPFAILDFRLPEAEAETGFEEITFTRLLPIQNRKSKIT
jgi:hypothetical protein